jgi:hypothetical protein
MRAKRTFLSVFYLSACLLMACCVPLPAQTAKTSVPPSPPVAPVKPVIDDYHGIKVSDPYRYYGKCSRPRGTVLVQGPE